MAQPTAYVPAYSFVSVSATLSGFPGQQLDVEFQDVKTTTDQIRNQLSLLQRDDSALANGVVTYDSLSAALQTAGLAPATAWAAGTSYLLGSAVTINSNLYRSTVAHTSGVFATDLAAAKWVLVAALIAGANGTNGTNGQGVPAGGTTGQFATKSSNADYAITWTSAPWISGTNLILGTSAGAALAGSTQNVLFGTNAGKLLTTGTGENVAIGNAAGQSMTTGTQNTIVGAEAGATLTSDTGHTLFGYQAGLTLNGASTTWNTFIGHAAGNLATGAGGCIAIGRAAGRGYLNDTDCLAVGHASFFYNNGGVCTSVSAIGNQAGGAPVDGTGTLWQGGTLTYWGPINDTNVMYMGSYTGKSSAAARANASAIGNLARLPLLDNVIVLGHAVTAVETAGRMWDGATPVTVNNNAGVTLSAAQMLTGIINRTGALGAGFNDTTATAAAIVAAGPGLNCEVPCSVPMVYINNGTTQTATILAGSGVTLAGIGTGISNNATVHWQIIVTNSTSGSEAVTFYRTS